MIYSASEKLHMKMPCIKILIKLAINFIQQIKSHCKQVENPNGTTSVHDLLQPNTLKILDWVTSNKFLRFSKQLQPVAWHQEKTDTGVEGFLKYKVRKEANKVILNGLFSEVSKTRDAVREWKAILLLFFFFLSWLWKT